MPAPLVALAAVGKGAAVGAKVAARVGIEVARVSARVTAETAKVTIRGGVRAMRVAGDVGRKVAKSGSDATRRAATRGMRTGRDAARRTTGIKEVRKTRVTKDVTKRNFARLHEKTSKFKPGDKVRPKSMEQKLDGVKARATQPTDVARESLKKSEGVLKKERAKQSTEIDRRSKAEKKARSESAERRRGRPENRRRTGERPENRREERQSRFRERMREKMTRKFQRDAEKLKHQKDDNSKKKRGGFSIDFNTNPPEEEGGA